MLPTPPLRVRLNDLPQILGPYARTAPVYVYQLGCGSLTASRFRRGSEEELLLVLGPQGTLSQAGGAALLCGGAGGGA